MHTALWKGGGRRPEDSERRKCGSSHLTITILPTEQVWQAKRNHTDLVAICYTCNRKNEQNVIEIQLGWKFLTGISSVTLFLASVTRSYSKRIPTPYMAKRFRKTTRYTRSRSNSRPVRRSRRYQRKATARMASVQYHTFTLVNQITLTKDANKSYSRIAWTSPNTSGVISPLMALNDDPLFKRLLSASDEFKIYSVYGTAFVSAPTGTGI